MPRTSSVRSRTALRLIAVPAAVLLATATVPPGPEPAAAGAPPAATAPRPAPREVTLLTGDRVSYVERTGTVTVVQAERADGEPVVFRTQRHGEDLFVIPSDVRPYLASGALDRELFNVKSLVRQGLGDDRAPALPVIVTYGKGVRSAAADAAALPATTGRARPLPSVNGAALRVDRARAAEFWSALDVPARPDARSLRLDRHVTSVRLDRRLRITLDASVPQVGAPEAWRAGYDGAGVTVAVLDTGVDPAHPDLADRIVEARTFVEGDGDARDDHGHGTHVSSIVAGSGAASGGRYKGVAPGAKLRVGKVCDANGECPESAILAGMDWAAHSGAKVVNLSLGGAPTDGTDLLSERVNALTAETGVLFVVAAGNLGCAPCVSSPGTAEAALTVGAVDKSDRLAGFSGRGPRHGDAGAKPEIVAPGVAITAARAAGKLPGYPGDDRYTELSGTSMATPHVAGAAAILAQARPQAGAAQLKDALAATARDDGATWYEQGAGRLDLTRALRPVTGPASLSMGRLARDHGTVTRTVTYHNAGDSAVTLRLAFAPKGWDNRATGAARLSTTELVVPAHGQAGVALTVDPAAGEPGAYGGTLTATGDGVTLRTPTSWYTSYPPVARHDLTIKMIDRDGKPLADEFPYVMRDAYSRELTPNDPFAPYEWDYPTTQPVPGTWVVSVPPGTYSVIASEWTMRPGLRRATLLAATNIAVHGPAQATLDGRRAVPATAVPPEPAYRYNQAMSVSLQGADNGGILMTLGTGNMQDGQLYATPAATPKRGQLAIQETYTLGQQTVRVRARTGGRTVALRPQYEPYAVARKLTGEHALPVVFAGAGRAEDFAGVDAKGKAALVRLSMSGDGNDAWHEVAKATDAAATNAAAAGAVALVPYLDVPGALPIRPLTAGPRANPTPILSLGNAEGESLRRALDSSGALLDLRVRTNPSFLYNLHYAPPFGVPRDLTHRVDPGQLLRTRTRYHADVPNLALNAWTFAFESDRGGTYQGASVYLQAPAELEQYVGGATGKQLWRRQALLTDGRNQFGQLDFEPYRGAAESWFAGPVSMVVPDQRTVPAFFRYKPSQGPDRLWASPYLGDAATGHFINIDFGHVYPFSYRLFRGGTQIPGRVGFAHTPTFELPPGEAEYRLEGTFVLPADGVYGPTDKVRRMSPRVDNVWTFRSGPPAGGDCGTVPHCAVQPLLQLRYDLGVDLTNRAPAGKRHLITITATAPQGASRTRIAGLTLSYSTDDGATWRQAAAMPAGVGRYRVLVSHPELAATAGTVWLRTEAWDTAGNRVTQTVQRAYGLGG